MTTPRKFTATVGYSETMWRDIQAIKYGPPFTRLVASCTETPPTEEQWAEYREALDLFEKLNQSPYFHIGGYDAEVTVEEPQPTVTIEYAETEDEWAARVRTLNPDDYEPIMTRFMRGAMQSFAKEAQR